MRPASFTSSTCIGVTEVPLFFSYLPFVEEELPYKPDLGVLLIWRVTDV